MKKDTNCAAVMIARGALGNPLIFAQAAALFAGRVPREFPARWRLALALWQAQAFALQFSEDLGVRRMRAFACWYSRGIPGAAKFRREVCRASDLHSLARAIMALAAGLPSTSISEATDGARLEEIVFQ